jgi:hypothetical protein
MRAVYKYPFPLRDKFTMVRPMGSKVRHVGMQPTEGLPHMWLELDPSDSGLLNHLHTYHVIGTGRPVPEYMTHVATFMVDGGRLVWHLYENEAQQAPTPNAPLGAVVFGTKEAAKEILEQVERWTEANKAEGPDGQPQNVSTLDGPNGVHESPAAGKAPL